MIEGTMRSLVIAALHLHIPLHFHPRGPQLDYVGVFLAAILSWAGLPGPGEAVLIAAAVSAAHHHLDLPSLIAVAWLGATTGGMLGWLVGLKGGRSLVTAPGPLRSHRVAVVARGDRFFARYGVVAVLFTPSWVAGIVHMRWTRYVPVNAVSALAWALAVGIAAYEAGPVVADIGADVGSGLWIVLGVVVVVAVAGSLLRRRRGRGDVGG